MHQLTRLDRASPESQGVDSTAVLSLVRALGEENLGSHSLMVLRHGKVIAEGWWRPYSAERAHIMFSISKSFTATAIALAEAEGLLSIDDPILSFFPTYATPEVVENVRHVKVRHLLAMATGHAVDTMEVMRPLPGEDWVKIFLSTPIVFPPGSHFLYNSGASFVLSALLTARTGKSPLEFLTPRLLAPLGIETPPWEVNPRGIQLGASGLRLRTEDVAKFAQLYLQKGRWNGQQLLPEAWVDLATSSQVSNGNIRDSDWSQGYGFQFWRTRHNGYRADGAYGQFGLVFPDEDLVVAITAGTTKNRDVPGLVWDHLAAGLHTAPLPEDPAAAEELGNELLGLELARPQFPAEAPALIERWNGRRVGVSFNTLGVVSLTLAFDEDEVTLTLRTAKGREETIRGGRNTWSPGRTFLWPYEEMRAVATATSAGWVEPQKLEFHEQCVDTPFRRIWSFEFDDSGVMTVGVGLNLGFWDVRTEWLLASADGERS